MTVLVPLIILLILLDLIAAAVLFYLWTDLKDDLSSWQREREDAHGNFSASILLRISQLERKVNAQGNTEPAQASELVAGTIGRAPERQHQDRV